MVPRETVRVVPLDCDLNVSHGFSSGSTEGLGETKLNQADYHLENLTRQWSNNRVQTENQELQPWTAVSTWLGLVNTV